MIRRLPWTRFILEKVGRISRELLKYSDPKWSEIQTIYKVKISASFLAFCSIFLSLISLLVGFSLFLPIPIFNENATFALLVLRNLFWERRTIIFRLILLVFLFFTLVVDTHPHFLFPFCEVIFSESYFVSFWLFVDIVEILCDKFGFKKWTSWRPLSGVFVQKSNNQILRFQGNDSHLIFEGYFILFDVFESFLFVWPQEGRGEEEQLVEDDSDAVDIDGVGVRLFFDHFWTDVLHGAAEGGSPLEVGLDVVSATTEVTDLYVGVFVQQDVFQLEVSVHDVSFVHGGHCVNELLKNGGNFFVWKLLSFLVDCVFHDVLSDARVPCLQYSSRI